MMYCLILILIFVVTISSNEIRNKFIENMGSEIVNSSHDNIVCERLNSPIANDNTNYRDLVYILSSAVPNSTISFGGIDFNRLKRIGIYYKKTIVFPPRQFIITNITQADLQYLNI